MSLSSVNNQHLELPVITPELEFPSSCNAMEPLSGILYICIADYSIKRQCDCSLNLDDLVAAVGMNDYGGGDSFDVNNK